MTGTDNEHRTEKDVPSSASKRLRWALPAVLLLVTADCIVAVAMGWGPRAAYNIAMMRDVLLGHYTVGQTTTLTLLALITLAISTVLLTRRERIKVRAVQVTAMVISILVTLVLADAVLRFIIPGGYSIEGRLMKRTAHYSRHGTIRDKPPASFTFPAAREGFPAFDFTFTCDERGFRNPEALDHCDVLAVGDSFVEGSHCSNDQTWPSVLTRLSGQSVYNVGCSGGDPDNYLAAIEAIGSRLKPSTVILMLYEGNDFRPPKNYENPTLSHRIRLYRKSSPVLRIFRTAMTAALGPVGYRHRDQLPRDHRLWPVAWLPLEYPADSGCFYAPDWKMVAWHLQNRETFQQTAGYAKTTADLQAVKRACDELGAHLVIVYAPDKAHVVLPGAAEAGLLNEEQIHAYFALKLGDDAPDIQAFIANAGAAEKALADWCADNNIDFLSLTDPLRRRVAGGDQLYYTYDQHWTPTGYAAAAEIINGYLSTPDGPRP